MFPHLPLCNAAALLPPLLPPLPPLPPSPLPPLFSDATLQWRLVATITRKEILNLARRPLRDRASLVAHHTNSKEAIILYNNFLMDFLCVHRTPKKFTTTIFCDIMLLWIVILWSVCSINIYYYYYTIHILYIYIYYISIHVLLHGLFGHTL